MGGHRMRVRTTDYELPTQLAGMAILNRDGHLANKLAKRASYVHNLGL